MYFQTSKKWSLVATICGQHLTRPHKSFPACTLGHRQESFLNQRQRSYLHVEQGPPPPPPPQLLLTAGRKNHSWIVPPVKNPHTLWTCPTAEHPTHRGPAPPSSTLLTVNLPQRRIPYSQWNCQTADPPRPCTTAEHHTHHGPAPPWYTIHNCFKDFFLLWTLRRID